MKIELHPPLSIYEIGKRQKQEDAIAQWDNRLFILCDGMGGHAMGEVASQGVCRSLTRWFEEHISPSAPLTDDHLREALECAYTELDQYADSSRQMGTTLTLLYINRCGVTAAHIGDSRIYHIRPNVGLLYQSRDHSLAFDLFQAEEITYEEMLNHPRKNIITRAMTPGKDNRARPDIIHITDIKPDDWFFLCSDGMMEQMTNADLMAVFCADLLDKGKMQQLRLATIQHYDNHSAWLLHVKSVTREEGDEALINEELTARCNALLILPKADEHDVTIVKEGAKGNTVVQKMKSVVNFIMNKNN